MQQIETPCFNDFLPSLSSLVQRIDNFKQEAMSYLDTTHSRIDEALEKSTISKKDNTQNYLNIKEVILKTMPLESIDQSSKNLYKYISKVGKKIDKISQSSDKSQRQLSTALNLCKKPQLLESHVLFSLVKQRYYPLGHIFEKELNDTFNNCKILEKYKEFLSNVKTIEDSTGKFLLDLITEWLNKNKLPGLARKTLEDSVKIQRVIAKIIQGQLNEASQDACFLLENDPQILISIKALIYFLSKKIINLDDFVHCENLSEEKELLVARYNKFLDPKKWNDIKVTFSNYAEAYYEIIRSSPINIVFKAGIEYAQNKVLSPTIPSGVDRKIYLELISLNLKRDFYYHDIIICPVIREICTKNNLPHLLGCGHLLSETALKKIYNGSNLIYPERKIFECPMCHCSQDFNKILRLNVK